jgi:hypothetical protein
MKYKQCEGCETDRLDDVALYDVTFTNDEEKKVWYCLPCSDLAARNFNGCTVTIKPDTSYYNDSDGHTYWLGQGFYPSGARLWMSAPTYADNSVDMTCTYYVAEYDIAEDDLDKLEKWLKAIENLIDFENRLTTSFNLFDYMVAIAQNFWRTHPHLEPMSMDDSLMCGNYFTAAEEDWQERYSNLWDRMQERIRKRRGI